MKPPERLIRRILRSGPLNDLDVPRPLLTLEEFFEGNQDAGSIGCNLPDVPGPRVFYEVFRQLRERPDVADVRVQITSWDDPDYWPFSDTVWIVTSLAPYDIQHRLGKRLYADDAKVGWPDYPMERIEVPAGMMPISVWWD
jgi:hypothetical protein